MAAGPVQDHAVAARQPDLHARLRGTQPHSGGGLRVRAHCQHLAKLAEVTGEPAVMWGRASSASGGYEGTSALAGFAPRKAHLVLYLVGGFEQRHQKPLARLGPHKTGKGCLYLKRLVDIDLDVLRELVDRSVRVRRGVDRTSGAP